MSPSKSYYDSRVMLSPRQAGIHLPYVEGLRIDEAMHPLTMLIVGLYGETLPNQNGAPMRLIVPWKYGFKSIKSITRIRLTEKPPATTWSTEWPQAYGFYANVNPKHAHPRYDQDTEDRLDGSGILRQGRKLRTQMFNGYGSQVAGLLLGSRSESELLSSATRSITRGLVSARTSSSQWNFQCPYPWRVVSSSNPDDTSTPSCLRARSPAGAAAFVL